MKNTKLVFLVLMVISVAVTSCKKEEKAKPEITNFELGYDGDKTAIAGEELHMDAEVVAEGTISTIRVYIHPEGDHHLKDGDEWEVDTTYTKFSGLKNTSFHEHIDVPAEADTGHYHFHFSVVDMEGYESEYEDELEVILQ